MIFLEQLPLATAEAELLVLRKLEDLFEKEADKARPAGALDDEEENMCF